MEVGMNGSKRKKNKPNMHKGTTLKYWAALNQNLKFLWKRRDDRTVIGLKDSFIRPLFLSVCIARGVCLVTP